MLVAVAYRREVAEEKVTVVCNPKHLKYMERPKLLEEQRADPIASQEYQFEFPKGRSAVGESFDICIEGTQVDTQIRL